ncbi:MULTISPECIES: NAD(P)/FAD-dependent oxidoreductase [unclassified Moorena]|uniref:FAD-dependent oxidoreductase n=2 Tax=unclassified Moorena TaxID=2683338 RepID=UPI0013B8CB75|nr:MULTISPECIES: NAD(P)/FAD-dependent oxidoreductase [unclassified Moorena]NEP35825.1 FAD-dependent monooxygenase [Moorena sp. SIO3B2]NEQ07675.1 FAD-dependent monooxygenase [Moorena sp. SIO4E2]NEQ17535.1 FAD-dependent monooxygenase [Moorena sp. SIO3E2]NES84033.1 FAD-dependent monooxygenase [Moorena sp. SIO2B7]NEP69854.1 FAD-dependent monooxygenase [Moorena sp. SIO3A5]
MKLQASAQEKTQMGKSSKPFMEKVAIIGAGLGGLAVAIALRKWGYDVQVYEKAQDFRPVGGGLGLLPNGLNFLDAIEPGIVETIKKSGCEVRKSVLKNTQGETLRTNPASRFDDKYGQPLITVWWWRLQQIMASKLPSDSIHLNHRCIGFEQYDRHVSIYFDNGEKVSADLLIGGDGINSAIREALIGDGKPRYLGSMSWRTVIKCNQELLNPGELGFVKGNQEFMYLLNVGDGHISWLYRKLLPDCIVSQDAAEVKSRVLDQLADWGESLRSLVEATPAERILAGPICDRLPLKYWSQGRVTLLGDAAHPMAPAMAQGANSTFEDAYELAFCCSQASSIEEALATYEHRRIPRTQLMQTRSALGEMRYYTTDRETANQQIQEQSQMSSEEYQDWVFNYKPEVKFDYNYSSL